MCRLEPRACVANDHLTDQREDVMTRTFTSEVTRRQVLRHAGIGAAGASALANGFRPAVSAAQEGATLTWLLDLPEAELIANRFMELNPDVQVEVEIVTFREVFQQN